MRTFPALCLLLSICSPSSASSAFPTPQIPYAPRHQICYRAEASPRIDGSPGDPAWGAASWSEPFVDIEGDLRPLPPLRTRVKMLWDDQCLYILAEMEEPHLWATYTARDAVIYHENDFEVFIDPDGDTHLYYELEINALNTVWDLLLVRPYRDGGPAVHGWDIAGLETASLLDGTLNDPSDLDAGWSVEIAFPWDALRECAGRPVPPADGDLWRVNFSRVEWRLDSTEGRYRKVTDPATGKPLPEANWVWSPQGLIAMHYPEMWGFVQFSAIPAGTAAAPPHADPDDGRFWALRLLYYAQKERVERGLGFAGDLSVLATSTFISEQAALPEARIVVTPTGFEASLNGAEGATLHIDDAGRVWRTP